jgi:hypothetical protein
MGADSGRSYLPAGAALPSVLHRTGRYRPDGIERDYESPTRSATPRCLRDTAHRISAGRDHRALDRWGESAARSDHPGRPCTDFRRVSKEPGPVPQN